MILGGDENYGPRTSSSFPSLPPPTIIGIVVVVDSYYHYYSIIVSYKLVPTTGAGEY